MDANITKGKISFKERCAAILSAAFSPTVLYYIISFFITRPQIFGGMMPFGIALFAAEYTSSLPTLIGVFIVISSFIVGQNVMTMIKYIACLVLFSLVIKKTYKLKEHLTARAALMGICSLFTSFLVLVGSNILLYDYIMMTIEALLVFGLTLIFANAKRIFFTSGIRPYKKSEDMICISVACASVIIGMGGGIQIYDVSVIQFLCVLACLIFSYSGRVSSAVISGIAIGLTAGIADGEIASVLGAFALSSLASGFFSKYGKAACLLAFIGINSMITLYTGGTGEAIINLYVILSAGAVFMLLPSKFISKFAFIKKETNSSEACAAASKELTLLSSALYDISDTYRLISANNLLGDNASAAAFLDRTVKTACEGCTRRGICWKKEFNRTYSGLFVVFKTCEQKGVLTPKDLPAVLHEKCIGQSKLISTVNTMYDIYKVDKLWESRVREARSMVALQLKNISDTIMSTADRIISQNDYDLLSGDNIGFALFENKMFTKSVRLTNNHSVKMLDIDFKTDILGREDEMLNTVNHVLGDKMKIIYRKNNFVRMASQSRYDINISCAAKCKETVSGDTFEFIYTPDGKCLLMLSDGMGSGEKAGADSHAVIKILSNMISAGFDIDAAIGMINSVLILKSCDTSFATLDLLLIDTVSGEAEFIKSGAADSFIMCDGKTRKISAHNLPAGVSENPDCAKTKCRLSPNSVIIMMSDGISGVFENNDTISEIIQNFKGDNPDLLANQIMEAAYEKTDNRLQDDMTVSAVIIKKNV